EAAEAGETDAAVNLGLMYLDGVGTPVNNGEALRWTRLAAEAGNAVGQNNLGHLYEQGLGVARDTAAAARWYQKAAEQGYALGAENFARLGIVPVPEMRRPQPRKIVNR